MYKHIVLGYLILNTINMTTVRPLELKYDDGTLIIEAETDVGHYNAAIFYLQKKTEDLSDDEFIVWLKNKQAKGSCDVGERMELEDDVFGKEFAGLQKQFKYLPTAVYCFINFLVDANGLSNMYMEGKENE